VTKFSFATKTGFSPKNPNKINQDQYLVMPHLGEYRRTHFFAVCDGHGVFGREVSEYVKNNLSMNVEQGIKYTFDQAKMQ
jgi:serine/threonine protein phosphatase PrpC